MAPKEKYGKGKAIDQSTAWSEWAWSEDYSCWAASRIGPDGKPEYDYRDPEPSVATPRFTGPDIVTTPNYYSTTTSSNTAQYPAESEGAYTTVPLSSSDQDSTQTSHSHAKETYYGNEASTGSNYVESTSSSYEEAGDNSLRPPSSSSATGSVSTIKYSMTPMTTTGSSTSRQPYMASQQVQNYGYEDVTSEAFQGLSVGTSSMPRTTAGNSSYQQSEWSSADPSTGSVASTELNTRYKEYKTEYKEVSKNKQKSFFKTGRVFLALWTEPARAGASTAKNQFSTSSLVNTIYGGTAFTEIRRFVIVQAGYGSSICCPIHTYQNQATLKHNLPEARQHAIIYTSDYPPNEFWYTASDGTVVQESLTKDPIKVRREEPGPQGDLGNASRINYSKVYTIEHYVKVLNIGMVEENWLPTLNHNSFVKRDEPPEKPRNIPSRSSRSDERRHDRHGKHEKSDKHDKQDKHDKKHDKQDKHGHKGGKGKGGDREKVNR